MSEKFLMAAVRTTRWRWISGILGILCLLLMISLGILLIYRNQSTKQTITSRSTVEYQEGYSNCSSCLQGWIGYQCNCYFISMERKSWGASKIFCESMNSSLLQMHSKDELNFLRYSKKYYWVGVSYNKDRGTWLWLNGSAVKLNLFEGHSTLKPANCIWYSASYIFDSSCEDENYFICKQPFV